MYYVTKECPYTLVRHETPYLKYFYTNTYS